MLYTIEIPDVKYCDVLVCGAGPSGLVAAATAAKTGLKTILLERFGMVGGSMIAGNVSTLMGLGTPGGTWQEIMDLLGATDSGVAIDTEKAKTALLTWLKATGVQLHLLTPVIDSIVEHNSIKGVIALTPQGPTAYYAKRIIDATGDGYIAYRAGCNVFYGRKEDGLVQPVSLMYHINGVDPSCTLVCRHEEDDTILQNGKSYLTACEEAAASGLLPKHVTIVRLYPSAENKGEYLVNATQVGSVNTLDNVQLSIAEMELREQIEQINSFLKNQVPGFEHIKINQSAFSIGIRESRRIQGHYVLTGKDVMEGRKFEDVIVHNAFFPIDIHNPTGGGQAETNGLPHQAQPYDIPMRCIIPLGVDNLILCGRNISGTHRALASYRVMNIAMSIGQAAGLLAKASLDTSLKLSEVTASAVQTLLVSNGCQLWN